ncbi:ECF transporter S component [Pseudogemmobacter bohemicus]|uniref:ECF transporter S component n=1 Tax=Pseudogemmobacter bohemicus TaxID=2250708 RepID=UPI002FCD7628
MAIAIARNIALGQAASFLKLPIVFDSIRTVLATVLAGPVAGGLMGLLTNLIRGLIQGLTAAFFAPVALVTGVVAGLLARVGFFREVWQAAISGVIVTIALALIPVPIRIYLFGGVTGSGADFLTAYPLKLGQDLFPSVLITVPGWNIADQVLTCVLVWGILRGLPGRATSDWPFLAHSRA